MKNYQSLGHVCTLPTYWTGIVAVGTVFKCFDCGRVWWLDEERKWASGETDEGGKE